MTVLDARRKPLRAIKKTVCNIYLTAVTVARALNTGVIINHQRSKSKIQKQTLTHRHADTCEYSLTPTHPYTHSLSVPHSIMCVRVFRELAAGRCLPGSVLINFKQQTLGKTTPKECKVIKANILTYDTYYIHMYISCGLYKMFIESTAWQ